MKFVIFGIIISVCCAQTPTRPSIAETFASQVSFPAHIACTRGATTTHTVGRPATAVKVLSLQKFTLTIDLRQGFRFGPFYHFSMVIGSACAIKLLILLICQVA